MRILYQEDDDKTTKHVSLMLEQAGHTVVSTDNYMDFYDLAVTCHFDFMVMGDGDKAHETLGLLRNRKINTPAIALRTMAGSVSYIEDKLTFYGQGGDDYLEKPFHREELLARIDAIHRRFVGRAMYYAIGEYRIDTQNKQVTRNDQILRLTSNEYLILETLFARSGETVTKDTLLFVLYGENENLPELKIIDVFIAKLRRKLDPDNPASSDSLIKTVWGRGYTIPNNAEDNDNE